MEWEHHMWVIHLFKYLLSTHYVRQLIEISIKYVYQKRVPVLMELTNILEELEGGVHGRKSNKRNEQNL